MIHCRNCPYLVNHDEDGLILTCTLTGQQCYLDDLPFTTMPGCKLEET